MEGLKNPIVFLLCAIFQQIFGGSKNFEIPLWRSVIRHAQFGVITKSLQVGDLIEVEDDKDGARKGLVISQPENL